MCGLFLTVKFSCLFTAVAVLACLRSLLLKVPYSFKVRTHEATYRGDISPVENTPGDKSWGHTFVTTTCRMNSNHLESMRHVAGTTFCPCDKISHGAYDGICPCDMSVLTFMTARKLITDLVGNYLIIGKNMTSHA